MNKISFVLIYFFVSSYGYSQQDVVITTEGDSSSNIYYHSLNVFLENIESSIQSYKESGNESYKEMDQYFRDMYILESDFTSKSIIQYKNPRIELLSEDKLNELVKKSGVEKRLKIIPLRKDKEYFFVNILLFNCHLVDNELQYSNITGTSMRYKFNCELNTFELVKDDDTGNNTN